MPPALAYPRTMTNIRSHVRRLGGAAETRELVALGIAPHRLTGAVRAGELVRVRRGWYALRDTDPALLDAIRVGGRLACVSAAAYYGWATPERHGLHVCVTENASRLRMPAHSSRPAPTVHWGSPRSAGELSRLVTDRFETVVQIVGCLDPESAVAALDSFLHDDPARSRDLEMWLDSLPTWLTRELPTRTALCHSYLETIGRIRLERAGIRGRHQVEFRGIGRVDLVIGDRVVIEWDGGTHRTAEQQDEDCRRDALLATLGYRTLRFSYRLVMEEWHLVIAAIRAALEPVDRTR
jgi:very-short-patch-repair endonuclease